MMYLFFVISVLCAIFLKTGIASTLGIEKVTTIAFAPMICYSVILLVTKKIKYNILQYNKLAVYLLILAVILILFKLSLGQDYYLKRVLELLIVPMLMTICFENLSRKEFKTLYLIVLTFFIIESGLAIVEWSLERTFFSTFFEDDTEFWLARGFFRSTSLLGRHPLANAQVVAVYMAFIAFANFKNKTYQIMLFFLGYVSLFCFNARGAILVVTVILVPFFVWEINKHANKRMKWLINIGVFIMFCGLVYLVTQTPLGGRLMKSDLLDSSANTRLDVFQFYKFYQSPDDFIWGSDVLYEYMTDKLGAAGVENGLITFLLDYGIIFTIPMLLLLFKFQYNKLSVYPKTEKWILLAVFFIIGSMNPNLASPAQWTLWVFAYYTFRPKPLITQTKNVKITNN